MRRAVHSAPTYVVARCGLSSPSPSARNTRSFPAPPLSSSTRRSRFLHYSASPTSLPLPLSLGHTSARRRTRSARRHPRLLDPERKDRGAADALSLWAGDNRRSNGNSVALGIFERRLRQLLVNHIDVVKAREGRISSVRSATMARMSSSRSDSGTGLRGSAVGVIFLRRKDEILSNGCALSWGAGDAIPSPVFVDRGGRTVPNASLRTLCRADFPRSFGSGCTACT
ncbi:hypothetical protein DFH06DRAFT_114067 [Mycena polygramma]|nr:hypothetical protein DFH06DRAFT_114067 [Mycena polygramma]